MSGRVVQARQFAFEVAADAAELDGVGAVLVNDVREADGLAVDQNVDARSVREGDFVHAALMTGRPKKSRGLAE